MAPKKRKRPHDATEALTRRATRHSTAAASEPAKKLRSGKVRANTEGETLVTNSRSSLAQEGGSNATKTKGKATAAAPPTTANAIRRTKEQAVSAAAPDYDEPDDDEREKENVKPEPARQPEPTAPTAPSPQLPQLPIRPTPARKVEAAHQSPAQKTPRNQKRIRPTRRHSVRPQAPASSLSDPAAGSAVTPSRHGPTLKPPQTPGTDRNIDKVVLGNISFKAWYPSYYGKEVLGDISNNANGKENGGGTTKIGGGKKDKEVMLDRLYVCPCCFKYSKEMVSWSQHVKICEKKGEVPGQKIYTNPRGRWRVKKRGGLHGETTKAKVKNKTYLATNILEEIVTDDGEWSVWEVDGENEGLFCQNLSLFAKLFLDNKSVFFDVTGFNYFLLVHTPPPTPVNPNSPDPHTPPRPQITGFFSKEKMSWDNNNLACILVFPPWQRKGLGSLLMGVSYEISRREGILGGPEKPISELGRKGYKRFWAGEIARWLLSIPDVPTPLESKRSLRTAEQQEEKLVDVDECSQATWIAPEDCLVVLREMGVVTEVGMGPPKNKSETAEDEAEPEKEKEREKDSKEVARVKVDKEIVRQWVEANKISLERTCDPDGFVGGYAIPEVEAEEVEEE